MFEDIIIKKSHLLGAVHTCVLIAGVLLTSTANAMLINIDFGPNGSDVYTGQGILGIASDDHWNLVGSVGATGLSFADGSAGTVDVAVTFSNGHSNNGSNALLEDDIETSGNIAEQFITISGLTANSIFDIVLYNSSFAQEYSIVDQASVGTASTYPDASSKNTDLADWEEDVEYAWLRSAMSDGNGQLQILDTPIQVPDSGYGAAIAGLQIQEITTVPVPAAVWLFGSGLLGLVGIARRKKT